jgi:hypothetical protein
MQSGGRQGGALSFNGASRQGCRKRDGSGGLLLESTFASEGDVAGFGSAHHAVQRRADGRRQRRRQRRTGGTLKITDAMHRTLVMTIVGTGQGNSDFAVGEDLTHHLVVSYA